MSTLTLRVTKTRATDETSELHYSERDSDTALCCAPNQGRTTRADRIYNRPWCFTCIETKRLDYDEED